MSNWGAQNSCIVRGKLSSSSPTQTCTSGAARAGCSVGPPAGTGWFGSGRTGSGPGPSPAWVRARPRLARGHSGSGPARGRARHAHGGRLFLQWRMRRFRAREVPGASPIRLHSFGVAGGQAEQVADRGHGCAAAGALGRCVARAHAGRRPIFFAPCSALALPRAAGFVAGRGSRVSNEYLAPCGCDDYLSDRLTHRCRMRVLRASSRVCFGCERTREYAGRRRTQRGLVSLCATKEAQLGEERCGGKSSDSQSRRSNVDGQARRRDWLGSSGVRIKAGSTAGHWAPARTAMVLNTRCGLTLACLFRWRC
jgi:hypothetical protein